MDTHAKPKVLPGCEIFEKATKKAKQVLKAILKGIKI